MPYITNKTSKDSADIFYVDYGSGKPVILIHGWPLSHKSWEGQITTLVDAGYRCIAYDRRGFGNSSAPWDGYDYSSLASDLREIILQLDLKDCIICGFSMGGGEVVRYFTDYGADRIAKAVLINSIIPLVKQKQDNPNGVPEEVLKGIMDALKTNRVTFLEQFHRNFYNYSEDMQTVSPQHLQFDWQIASQASFRATIKAAEAWAETDFRAELKNVAVPTLILHGDADNIVPIETAGMQAAKGIANNQFVEVAGAPHGMNATHKEELNKHLLDFLKQ
jgi:pimeloyl-ACP methyl ester carboxylesterase